MFPKKKILIFFILLLYQSPIYSKSNSFSDFNSKNLSRYFSGIVAFENNNNSEALDFFNSSKVLVNKHDPYLKRLINSLVLENRVLQAINEIKKNKSRKNSEFFDAYLLLTLDNIKKNNFDLASQHLKNASALAQPSNFDTAIVETLEQYIFVFKEKKILRDKKNFGKFSTISETFQKCYLGNNDTDTFFKKLFNDVRNDYTRYIYFYLSYLIEKNRLQDAKEISEKIQYANTTLLLSQGKSWIENGNMEKFSQFFTCTDHNHIISEFLFLISNLYSSQDNFERSNYFLNLSIYLNPKFIFNLSLIAENHYFNGEYKKAKKTLKNFKKDNEFYYWYRVKKETQIIAKLKNKKESLNYIKSEFNKIEKPNEKHLFDMANFFRNAKEYNEAINYYTKIIQIIGDDPEIKSDLLYRRGGCHERIGNYEEADKDLLLSLNIKPNDAYVLNYLAYSWLERDYRIDEAIKMLETAYAEKSDDPYIIDSIGWAYYLIDDFIEAEKFLKRAVELMPDDPIVNDHYGDILWKLDRKIQARYFWSNVLEMKDTENDMIEKINKKFIEGPKS